MKHLTCQIGNVVVSTVKIRLDDPFAVLLDTLANANKERFPYETMVFPIKDGIAVTASPLETLRYWTEEEAKAGHEQMVKKYKEKKESKKSIAKRR